MAYEVDKEAGFASQRAVLETRDNLLGDYFFGSIKEVDSVFSALVLEEDRSVVLLHSWAGTAPGEVAVNNDDFFIAGCDAFLE